MEQVIILGDIYWEIYEQKLKVASVGRMLLVKIQACGKSMSMFAARFWARCMGRENFGVWKRECNFWAFIGRIMS